MDRRTFLRNTLGGLGFAVAGGSILTACDVISGDYGVLGAADANGLHLPAGFTSRIVATTGTVVAGTSYT